LYGCQSKLMETKRVIECQVIEPIETLIFVFFSHGSHGYTSRPIDQRPLPCIVRLDSRDDRRDIEKRTETRK